MTACHKAACNGKLDILLQVWEWAEKKLTTEEKTKKLLLTIDNEGMTAWYWATCNAELDILLEVWEWAEEKLTKDINYKLILAIDYAGMTTLLEAAYRGNQMF